MKTLPSYEKFNSCFENVPDLEELQKQAESKRKKKISKNNQSH